MAISPLLNNAWAISDWLPGLDASARGTVEAAYEPLTAEAWNELCGLIDYYALSANLEQSAATVSHGLERLQRLKSAAVEFASAFQQVNDLDVGRALGPLLAEEWERLFRRYRKHEEGWEVLRSTLNEAVSGEAPVEWADEVASDLRGRRVFPEPDLWYALDIAHEIGFSVDAVVQRFAAGQAPSTRPGAAWDSLILSLTAWAKRHRYPQGVRKDSGTVRRGDRPSPFVRLVMALQETFPVTYREHQHSAGALAAAIGRARKRGN